MANKWMQGPYTVRNKEKYIGRGTPKMRSSWEFVFANFCDNHAGILQWSSEPVRIPYRNPLTGKNSSYVPDFLIMYEDKNGKKHVDLIEIKPGSQATMESAGKSSRNKAAVILNQAKWQAAMAWAKSQGINFKILTEKDLFAMTGKK